MKTSLRILALFVFSVLGVGNAHAVQLTLNLVQAQSEITLTGSFGGLPMLSQDVAAPGAPVPGTTDFDATRPSNQTTFQGSITVDVDNVNAPTSIQILGSNANADLSGKWLPEVQPYLDRNGDSSFGDFGLPPDGDSCPAGGAQPAECTPGDGNPAPAVDADWAIRVFHPAFGVNLAYASARDIEYNVTMPGPVPVVAGAFSSATENFEFATGWLDYYVAQAAGNLRGRSELAGGDDDNQTANPSSFTVTDLPGNQKEFKLTIPLSITDVGDDATFAYDGQIVATLTLAPGDDPAYPILPTSGGSGAPFEFDNVAGDGNWFDPPLVGAYIYETDGNSNFTALQLPPLSSVPDGDSQYLVSSVHGDQVVAAGGNYVFPSPVDFFKVSGINPFVDGGNPLAFPTFLAFDEQMVSFTMTPIPEPSTTALMGIAMAFLASRATRRRK
jgi:hypothetical protein